MKLTKKQKEALIAGYLKMRGVRTEIITVKDYYKQLRKYEFQRLSKESRGDCNVS